MDTDDIRARVTAIRAAAERGAPTESLRAEHRDFYERYPKLFDVSCNVEFDLGHLEFMLYAMQGVREKRFEGKDADREVFDRLKREYVAPIEQRLREMGHASQDGGN